MVQELLNLLQVTASQAGWDATTDSNRQTIEEYIKTFKITISTQGGTGSPSTLDIQLQDAKGVDVSDQEFLRVRVCDNGGFSPATNATIAAVGNSTVIETKTASKDLVLKGHTDGLFQITLTDATAETVTLRIGPADLTLVFANYNNSLNVTHA